MLRAIRNLNLLPKLALDVEEMSSSNGSRIAARLYNKETGENIK